MKPNDGKEACDMVEKQKKLFDHNLIWNTMHEFHRQTEMSMDYQLTVIKLQDFIDSEIRRVLKEFAGEIKLEYSNGGSELSLGWNRAIDKMAEEIESALSKRGIEI